MQGIIIYFHFFSGQNITKEKGRILKIAIEKGKQISPQVGIVLALTFTYFEKAQH